MNENQMGILTILMSINLPSYVPTLIGPQDHGEMKTVTLYNSRGPMTKKEAEAFCMKFQEMNPKLYLLFRFQPRADTFCAMELENRHARKTINKSAYAE